MRRPKTDLRAHLEALVNGTASTPANTPSDETLAISRAICECADASLGDGEPGDEVLPRDTLPAPSSLLPPLP